ncbi:MAG TPA: hypothetical protein VFN68_00730 [Acidimicrobiales bacterium]|nr:hypothetical protein [Acidimicrobiales bacterium]
MSRSVDLFIDLEPPVESAVAEIQKLTPFSFVAGDVPGTWRLDEGDVHAELHAHPYVDDGDLLLGRYRWALSCRLGSGSRPADAPETALLRLVAEALQKGGVPNLLVHDLQYRERTGVPAAPGGDGPATTRP